MPRRPCSDRPTDRPKSVIVDAGPYRFTLNPIYLAMFLGLAGLGVGLDDLWLLIVLVPFALPIRYGVVAREEAYLDHRFGGAYRDDRARVRRWL